MNYFTSNILFLRKSKGLLQSDMKDMTGIGRATWSDYEKGKTEPKLDVLIKISEFFGITTDELLKIDLSENARAANEKDFSLITEQERIVKKQSESLIQEQLDNIKKELQDLRRQVEKKGK